VIVIVFGTVVSIDCNVPIPEFGAKLSCVTFPNVIIEPLPPIDLTVDTKSISNDLLVAAA
jgi:hypothetical protein